MPEVTGDEGWVDIEADDEFEEETDSPSPQGDPSDVPTTLESELISKIASHGVTLEAVSQRSLTFNANPKWNRRFSNSVVISRSLSGQLSQQIGDDVTVLTKWAGISIPKRGYTEVLLQSNSSITTGSFSLQQRISQLTSTDDFSCSHRSGDEPWEALALTSSNHRRRSDFRLHIAAAHTCIEISSPTPACHVLTNLGSRSPRYLLSIKIQLDHTSARGDMESQVEQLLNSLAYELDVRNHIRVLMARWPYGEKRLRATTREKAVRTVRFPETQLETEVAVLFGFAGSAVENPPLSYLSYYQVLESFFPAAAEKSALRSIELELADPAFNRQLDRYLLRILQIGKGTANASELAQLQTLIEEYVRRDKLRDFFRANDWGNHFSSKGPIGGCENISADEKNTNFTRQVTERVYKIRNRIVHAKDDPRFASVPPLLPQSDEAAALGPDIELVRLLACEVILSSQTRR